MAISWNLERIGADKAWERCRGEGVRIAVLDTGVDRRHPALAVNVKFSYDVVRETDDGEDGSGHGTYVAGIIAAANTGSDKVGVAPGAELYCLKVLEDDGFGQPSHLISAMAWCIENNMQVVNMSLGLPDDNLSVRQALQRAAESGILLVAAAGNDGAKSGRVWFPAAYDFVIAVTAVDRLNRVLPLSSRGPEVDLCAPGDEITSTDRYSHLSQWVRDSIPDGTFCIWPAGTSFAAPHVSGVAALVHSANRVITSTEVGQILRDTAENPGMPSSLQGAGLVSAAAAVEKAMP